MKWQMDGPSEHIPWIGFECVTFFIETIDWSTYIRYSFDFDVSFNAWTCNEFHATECVFVCGGHNK